MNTLVDTKFLGAADRDPPVYQSIEMDAVRAYRLAGGQSWSNVTWPACSSLNVRYTTDSTNMQV